MLLLNLLLTLAWLFLTGQFTPENFVFGFIVTYLMLWVFQRAVRSDTDGQRAGYFRKVAQVVEFALFFFKELVMANIRVAIDVLRPRPQMKPAVVTIPLAGYTDNEVTILANFITLTPGTLSLDVVDNDGIGSDGEATKDIEKDGHTMRTLRVHAMHAGETQAAIEQYCRQLKEQYAERVLEVMR